MQNTIGRPKDLEKRARILQAAKNSFLKMGYHGSSMNHIAQEANVTKLTVYNHFKDKETLFTSAIQETCAECISSQQFCLNAKSDFLKVFFEICECALNMIYLPEAIKLEHVLMELAAEKNPLATLFFNASHQHLINNLNEFFDHAMSLGLIKQDQSCNQTSLILSLLLGLQHHHVLLGICEVPSSDEIKATVGKSIELFMLKYQH